MVYTTLQGRVESMETNVREARQELDVVKRDIHKLSRLIEENRAQREAVEAIQQELKLVGDEIETEMLINAKLYQVALQLSNQQSACSRSAGEDLTVLKEAKRQVLSSKELNNCD